MTVLSDKDIDRIAVKVAQHLMTALSAKWLKISQAKLYACMGKDRLMQLAASGEITGFPDPDTKRGDWIFDKTSIDEYRKKQMSSIHVAKEAFRKKLKSKM